MNRSEATGILAYGPPPVVEPVWFGPVDAPLFGWVHTPAPGSVPVRAGVVLCPPLGRELINAHRTLRLTAERLTQRGFAVLRFDYGGTGDSSGDLHSVESAESIFSSVEHAARYLRACGAPSTALVGMRMGALLAARSASRVPTHECVVLWDPCVSGRAFLKEQDALLRLSDAAEYPGYEDAVEGPSMLMPGRVARDLRALSLRDLRPDALVAGADADAGPAILLLTRSELPPPPALADYVADPLVRHERVAGQPALIDVASNVSVVPENAVQCVVEYLDERFAGSRAAAFELSGARSATVARAMSGAPVVETVLEFGAGRLFGLASAVPDAEGPTVVFLNLAVEHHIGPGRAWVEMSRRLAAQGYRAVRFDSDGIGDSRWQQPLDEVFCYTQQSVADAVDVIRELRPFGKSVLVGLCSGAWTAIMAAAVAPPAVVYLVNPALWKPNQKPLGRGALALPADEWSTSSSSAGRARLRLRAWLRESLPRLRSAKLRVRAAFRRVAPEPLWVLLGRLGLVHAPVVLLQPVVRRGARVQIVYGPKDGSAIRERSQRSWQRLTGPDAAAGLPSSPGPVRIDFLDYGDHALLRARSRDVISDHLLAFMLAEFPLASRSGGIAADDHPAPRARVSE